MPPVVVYSKKSCQPCKATYRELDKLGIPYTTKDIMEDETAVDEVRALGYEGVPVVVVGEDHWHGFRSERIKELAALATA